MLARATVPVPQGRRALAPQERQAQEHRQLPLPGSPQSLVLARP